MKCKACPVALVLLLLFSLNTVAQGNYSDSRANSDMDPNASIISNTDSSSNHQMLSAAMKAAELDEILGFDGPFTVFAPSDQAFQKLPKTIYTDLLDPSNKRQVQALMTYHIIAGNFSASKILKAMCRGGGKATFTTVQGDELFATMRGIDIVLTDTLGNEAKITVADSNQCNGVIHEIDTVIGPTAL